MHIFTITRTDTYAFSQTRTYKCRVHPQASAATPIQRTVVLMFSPGIFLSPAKFSCFDAL